MTTSDHDGWIELKPGVPWAPPGELNRLARQQGLCQAIAKASVYDEICQAVQLSQEEAEELLRGRNPALHHLSPQINQKHQ